MIRTLLAFWVGLPAGLLAQVRASEPATVGQTIDGTTITIQYSRPRARTRDSLFGKVVTWGEVWTPGANMATTLELSKDVRVNDHSVPKGKYSVWLVVRPQGPWTAVLDTRDKLFHMAHPESTGTQIRFPVTPGKAEFSEVLTWSFPEVRIDGATLVMHWGEVRIPFAVKVEPSYQLTFAAERAGPYLGTFTFGWTGGPEVDKSITLFVTHEKGSLMGRWDPAPFPEWDRFYLISIGADVFVPGFLDKGALFDVEKGMVFEFKTVAGKATEFKVRGENDEAIASGKRKS